MTVLAGDGFTIVGRVHPSHHNRRAEVWRRLPHSGGVWRKIDTVGIARHGRMEWGWDTDDEDANSDASYGFQFRIPGHGRSNRVRVWVITPDW